jgi:hypothetical protein
MPFILNTLRVIVFLFLTLAISVDPMASGLRAIAYDELESYFSHICVVNVTRIETQPNHQTFTSGETRHISTTVVVNGFVLESLKGQCGQGEFASEYTTPVITDFDDAGNQTIRYTLLETESGIELTLEPNKTYALSYMHLDVNDETHKHMRADAIESKYELRLPTNGKH